MTSTSLPTVTDKKDKDSEKYNDDDVQVFNREGASVETGTVTILSDNPFEPFPTLPNIATEHMPLTIRAVLLGWLLGSLVNASNVYLGLKMGMANDANMLASIVGYHLMKACQSTAIPFLAAMAGPKEHNIIQTVATSTGGLSTLFVAAVPAMYQLGLMSDDPVKDYWRLVTLTAASAFFGTALSLPLREMFIIKMGKPLQLTFPSAVAAASTIRNFYLPGGRSELRQVVRVLFAVFGASLIWVIGSSYAKGILFDWYIFWWFYVWGGYSNGAIHMVNWGFQTIEWSPVFLGFGLIMGLNIAASWFSGYIIGYGIVGPILVAKGLAVGVPYSAEYPDLLTYLAMESTDLINAPSPRYWLLWPGIMVMVVAALTDILVRWRLFAQSIGMAGSRVRRFTKQLLSKSRPVLSSERASSSDVQDISRLTKLRDRVRKMEFWVSLFGSIIISCVVLGEHILTLALGWLFALMAVQCTGQSGTSPIGMVANLTQLIVAGIYRPTAGEAPEKHLMANLVSAAVASTAAQQATEMTTDFKIGYFLGTPHQLQWYGQWLGTIPAIFISPAMFILFMRGYGCVLDLTQAATCTFSAPAAITYRAVASAMLTYPTPPISQACWIFSGCACLMTIIIHSTKAWAISTGRHTLAAFLPNMLVVALGVLVPASQYGLALVMGALAGVWWQKKRPQGYQTFCFPVAAGMITGESIAGLVQAILNIAEVAGPNYYGTNLGCPAGYC
ncbi:hypothetical protein ACHAQD_012174 [Fusarium lateritium]